MVKICLSAIFRNESKNVNRCLNACKQALDYIFILDTGSTDNTVELIKTWGELNKIPTVVAQDVFKGFGKSRTQAAEEAIKTFPDADYLLFTDADMILRIGKNFNKNSLKDDYYEVLQKSRTSIYPNIRICKTTCEPKYYMNTHEFFFPGKANAKKGIIDVDFMFFDDMEDGGFKASKYHRDYELLIEELKGPQNPLTFDRIHYYLGQTCHCLGNTEGNPERYREAIKWFKKRVELNGYWEEKFIALKNIGDLNVNLGNPEEAIGWYLEAYNFCPRRAESLYGAIKCLRERGKNNAAYYLAKQARDIPFPKIEKLFVDYNVYEYLIDLEISIVAFYVDGEKGSGLNALKRLIGKFHKMDTMDQILTLYNAKFYGYEVSINKILPVLPVYPTIPPNQTNKKKEQLIGREDCLGTDSVCEHHGNFSKNAGMLRNLTRSFHRISPMLQNEVIKCFERYNVELVLADFASYNNLTELELIDQYKDKLSPTVRTAWEVALNEEKIRRGG